MYEDCRHKWHDKLSKISSIFIMYKYLFLAILPVFLALYLTLFQQSHNRLHATIQSGQLAYARLIPVKGIKHSQFFCSVVEPKLVGKGIALGISKRQVTVLFLLQKSSKLKIINTKIFLCLEVPKWNISLVLVFLFIVIGKMFSQLLLSLKKKKAKQVLVRVQEVVFSCPSESHCF